MNVSVTRVRLIRKLKFLTRQLHFDFDDEVFRQDASQQLVVSGWVIHRSVPIKQVLLRRAGDIVAAAGLEFNRPRVEELYPHSPDAAGAGYRLELSASPGERYKVEIELESGKRWVLAELELQLQEQPKLLFMHIPKAAGSTVNRFLASHFSGSRHVLHIESDPDWQRNPDRIRQLDFISGHVPLPQLARKLNLDDYQKLTVLREPYAQLASHLAWIRRLSDPGEEQRLERHPAYIQALSRQLSATDFADPASLKSLVSGLNESETRLLDNCQVRYFTVIPQGEHVSVLNLEQAVEDSAIFDRIGRADAVAEFLEAIARDMGWAPPRQAIMENISRSYYGLDFACEETRKALFALLRYDLDLYQRVTSSRTGNGRLSRS